MTARILRLGTRRSALARAQSSQVARRIEALHPGLTVELVGIDTRGDRIQDKPLSQVDGKEFFTAELDTALVEGRVDLTVHSGKDLALERPPAMHLVAMPTRANPRDVVLFAADVRERLAAGTGALRVGSSSPRRLAFVPGFLRRALPGAPAIELTELRGNVDTRLRRLHEPRGSERHLDGVVLALAGLERLWADASGRELLQTLLAPLPRMVLPLTHCPAAPAQGALAIECRRDDAATRALLEPLDDAATRAAVAVERELLAARGGGCHQQFGATQFAVPGLGALLYQRGMPEQGDGQAHMRWQPETALPARVAAPHWDGSAQREARARDVPGLPALAAAALARSDALFIAHRRAWPASLAPGLAGQRPCWVSGVDTWFALAERGLWIEGCAEGLGFDALRATLDLPVLALPGMERWLALTHQEAVAGWAPIRALASYELERGDDAAAAAAVASARALWWHSSAQFDRLGAKARADALHACGPGKTAAHLRRQGVHNLTVFPSVGKWREWLQA